MSLNKLALTIDIEDWYHIPSVTGSPFSVYSDVNEFFANWHGKYDYLTEPTQKVLNLLDEYDITATFFVVANIIEKYPDLVESIVERGHEIGCHGLNHECVIDPDSKNPIKSPQEFEDVTLKAKNILENLCGEKVVGYRAPNAMIGKWMFNSLERIGFKYDSSISVNSFYNKTDFPLDRVSSNPFYPIINNSNFLEFPFSYWNILGFKIPTSGGPMLRFFGAKVILKGITQSLGRGSTVFYFHPIDMGIERLPKLGRGRPFYWIIKGKIVERRIRYILNALLKKGYNIVSLYELYNVMGGPVE